MPTARRGNGPVDVVMAIECRHGCGLIGSVPAYDVARRVAEHFATRHPALAHADIIEPRDFVKYEAPYRCDACNEIAERPYWTHVATPPLREFPPIIDNDGLWLVCDPCHRDYIGGDLAAMVARNLAATQRQSPVILTMEGMRERVQSILEARFATLFERWDQGTRDEA